MKRWLIVVAAACGARTTMPPQPPPQKSLQLNAAGAMVDVDTAVVAGYVTLVDYWSESCAACGVVGGMIAVAIAKQDHVIVRKVDVGDGFTPVAQAYKIGTLPHWNVYDRKRRLRYILVGPDCLRAPDLARELLAEPFRVR